MFSLLRAKTIFLIKVNQYSTIGTYVSTYMYVYSIRITKIEHIVQNFTYTCTRYVFI